MSSYARSSMASLCADVASDPSRVLLSPSCIFSSRLFISRMSRSGSSIKFSVGLLATCSCICSLVNLQIRGGFHSVVVVACLLVDGVAIEGVVGVVFMLISGVAVLNVAPCVVSGDSLFSSALRGVLDAGGVFRSIRSCSGSHASR